MDLVVLHYESEDDREEFAIEICDALEIMFRVDIDRVDLKRRYENLSRRGLNMLALARIDDPHASRPADAYGWWASGHAPNHYQVAVINPSSLSVPPSQDLAADVKAAISTAVRFL